MATTHGKQHRLHLPDALHLTAPDSPAALFDAPNNRTATATRITLAATRIVVGWTFLNGQKFSPIYGQSSAAGDTIVNVKPGVRIGLGDAPGPAMMQKHSIYAGFGVPVTNEQFYSDIFRLEYRILF